MNNNDYKKEYMEKDIQELLKKESEAIKPSKMLLKSTLDKLPKKNIPSPYRSKVREFVFSFKKMSLAIGVMVIVILGTTTYVHHQGSVKASFSASSDIQNQVAAIDNQMSGLDMDVSVVDQALNYQPQLSHL